MRVSTTQIFSRALADMQAQQAGLARTQQQIASGQRILQPADDPVGAKRVLDLERGVAQAEQFAANGNLARSRLQREESVLVEVGEVLDRVRELGLQGNNATLSSADRAAVAREIEVGLEQLLSLANATDGNGEYLFSGFTTRTRPFALQGDGSVAYGGDQGGRRVQIGPTRDIPVGDAGSDVFTAVRTGNGTFVTGFDRANTGTGVIAPGSVTDNSQWDGGNYTLRVGVATGAAPTLAFADAGNADTLTYTLAIDGVSVYSVSSAGTPAASLADLAAQINDDEPTTGVEAVVDGGALYLRRSGPQGGPITVTETLSGASDGDLDGAVGYFGSNLNGASTPAASRSLASAARWFAEDAGGAQVASGDFASGAAIAFRGISTSIGGAPDSGDTFSVSPSVAQDMFATVRSMAAALTTPANSPGDGTPRQNDVNRALLDIDRALERVTEVRASIGARLNAIDQEAAAGEDFRVILNEALADVRDLDLAEAVTRLSSQSNALQAAQASFVRIQGLSLFNYLS